jgi:exodeoxyribonuclease VII large subunit
MQVSALRPAGVGLLQKAFEELKRRLDAEGLFDPHRKRTLPRYPRTIGIITSRTGAVLHDLQSVIERRYPLVRLLLWSVRVQGAEAASEIVEAVRGFNRLAPGHADRPDVLVVGRGGGSLEDLWPFNEERVARAIHASGIPVVSAVGHETDVTICDLVADVRAATPSVAAERMVPDVLELMRHLSDQVRGLGRRAGNRLSARRMQLASLDARLRLHAPERRIARVHQQVDDLLERLGRAVDTRLLGASGRVDSIHDRLRALDPSRPLQAGYALVRSADSVVRSAKWLRDGEAVTMQFSDGVTHARIEAGDQKAAGVDP